MILCNLLPKSFQTTQLRSTCYQRQLNVKQNGNNQKARNTCDELQYFVYS